MATHYVKTKHTLIKTEQVAHELLDRVKPRTLKEIFHLDNFSKSSGRDESKFVTTV